MDWYNDEYKEHWIWSLIWPPPPPPPPVHPTPIPQPPTPNPTPTPTPNKANLRDSIAATSLVILLKLDSNRRFWSPCDHEIWLMTPKNNWARLLYYMKLCALFQIHQLFLLFIFQLYLSVTDKEPVNLHGFQLPLLLYKCGQELIIIWYIICLMSVGGERY